MIVKNERMIKNKKAQKRELFRQENMNSSINEFIENIMCDEINYGDLLADRLKNATELKNWMFDLATVKLYRNDWVRNEQGHMNMKIVEYAKKRYTSNGEEKLIYLIKMAKKYESEKLTEIVDSAVEMLVDAYIEDECYFVKREDKRFDKKVMDTNFDNICAEYLTLPRDLQSKSTIINFFKNFEKTDDLKNSGYRAAKRLITEFKRELTKEDVKVLTNYIYSRLERMENRMFNFDCRELRREVNSFIKSTQEDIKQQNAIPTIKIGTMKKALADLAEFSNDEYKVLKAKYNKELSRYFQLIKPISEKHEIQSANSNCDAYVELYGDLEKTYEIINDEQFEICANNNTALCGKFEDHIEKCRNHVRALQSQKSIK